MAKKQIVTLKNIEQMLHPNMTVHYDILPQEYTVYPTGNHIDTPRYPYRFTINDGIATRSKPYRNHSSQIVRDMYKNKFNDLHTSVEELAPDFAKMDFEAIAFVLTMIYGEPEGFVYRNDELDMQKYVRSCNLSNSECNLVTGADYGKFILKDLKSGVVVPMPNYIYIRSSYWDEDRWNTMRNITRTSASYFIRALQKMRQK